MYLHCTLYLYEIYDYKNAKRIEIFVIYSCYRDKILQFLKNIQENDVIFNFIAFSSDKILNVFYFSIFSVEIADKFLSVQ